MKRILLITVLTSVMAILSISCFAQNKLSWVPEKGHWMLVSNIHNKKTITVQFYNEDNALIYEETLNNVRLNPNRKKVRRQLCLALDEAYNKWAANVQIASNDLIAKRK